jgi:hypothetical protein
VRLGIGPQYLERIKKGGEAAVPRFKPKRADVAESSAYSMGRSDGSYSYVLLILMTAAGIGIYLMLR